MDKNTNLKDIIINALDLNKALDKDTVKIYLSVYLYALSQYAYE